MPIMIGGVVRWLTEVGIQNKQRQSENSGTLFASGLIAGEALISVIIALFIVSGIVNPDAPVWMTSNWVSVGLFVLLAASLWWVARKGSVDRVN
jgi:hypothetical protein